MALEGGYDLTALEVSSEAVVKMLMVNPQDSVKVDELLQELSGKSESTYNQLETASQLNVRESFKSTASNVAKAHKKYWPCLSHLIYEKSKSRKSSMLSSQNSGDIKDLPF